MSLAQRAMDNVKDDVSDEARERLSSARYRDVAFAIKRRIGDRYSPEDVEMLVQIVVKATYDRQPLTRDLLVQGLREFGRSPQKSEELATALTQ